MISSKPKSPSINDKWVEEIPEDIIESFREPEPPVIFVGSGFGKEAIPPLKTGGELATELRKELDLLNNEDNLSELLQYLKNSRARTNRSVTEWLKKHLDHGNSEPGGAHRLLLELRCKIFLTTNYDSLLVDASRQMGYKLIPIDDPSSFESNYEDIKTKPKTGLLGRLHGSFEFQENIVATTDDYIDRFLGDKRWQELLENTFRNKRVVFIGYSLKDFTTWTSFISVFTKWKNATYPHVLVSPNKSSHIRDFWNQYRIRYIPLKASQFLITLHDQLGYLEKNKDVAIAAVAAYTGKTYDESLIEVEVQKKLHGYPTLELTALKMLMDGRNEN